MNIKWPIWLLGSSTKGRGSRALIGSALAFSLMTVCVKHISGRIPVSEIVFTRSLISLLITRLMLQRIGISPWGYHKRLLLIRGLLGTGALFCIFEAINNLPLASATIIQYTYPTFTAFAAWILIKEKVQSQIWLAVILGWAGVNLSVQSDLQGVERLHLGSYPVLIAFSGAFLTALAYICVRKLSQSEHQLVIVHYFPLISIPITIPFMVLDFVIPQGLDWLWLVGVGILTQIGQILITKGLSQLPAARASAINYVQVIFAMAWGIIIFSEPIDTRIIIGALLVLVSTIISVGVGNEIN